MATHDPVAPDKPRQPLRERLRVVIFGTETPAGRGFDIVLLVLILLSVVTIALESVAPLQARYGGMLDTAELVFTLIFTIEYALRIYSTDRRFEYLTSFFGVVDLLSILPTYLAILAPGLEAALVIRMLRLLRIFRVLKVVRMLGEAHALLRALRASAAKITVFLGTVLIVVVIVGTLMHFIEGPAAGFDSIPRSIYWAIVTLTTVGYGDIAPVTFLGQAVAATLMILGYGIIAVPTGIVSAELVQGRTESPVRQCTACGTRGHSPDALYCRICGEEIVE